jgi:hypothetical protein
MRRFLLISLVPLVVACSGPAVTTPAPAAVSGPTGAVTAPKPEAQAAAGKPEPKQASQAPSQAPAKTEPKPAAEAKSQTAAVASTAPKAVIASPAENHGIAIGQPFKSGANGSVVRVRNTTDQVMTFTVRTEYRKGADVISLSSRVMDLRQ